MTATDETIAPASSGVAHAMTTAALTWLDSLTAEQRAQGQYPWSQDEERRRWFYTPTDHGGLSLRAMSAAQQGLAMRVLATGLSEAGYVSASTIMGLENVLDRLEGWGVTWGRERGRDCQLYWLRVFGEPGPTGAWSWRFGGHHVSVQHTVFDGRVVSSTPCFLGADPAEAPLLGGHVLRPLGATEDLARDLVRSLNEQQARSAVIDPIAPVDIVGANRPELRHGDTALPLADVWRQRFTDPTISRNLARIQAVAEEEAGVTDEHLRSVAYTTTPKGLAASEMSDEQQDQLRKVLDAFLARIPDELAEDERMKYEGSAIDRMHFAWAGGIERGEPHYYRLQGPRLLAEYDNTQRDVNHIHTVWRDPTGDFGGAGDVLAAHLKVSHS